MPSSRSPKSGVSILEMLVVLAALAIISAVLLSGISMRPDPLGGQRRMTDLTSEVSAARARAVDTGAAVLLTDFAPACVDGESDLTIFPDGNATGGPYCFENTRVTVDTLTARLQEDARQ